MTTPDPTNGQVTLFASPSYITRLDHSTTGEKENTPKDDKSIEPKPTSNGEDTPPLKPSIQPERPTILMPSNSASALDMETYCALAAIVWSVDMTGICWYMTRYPISPCSTSNFLTALRLCSGIFGAASAYLAFFNFTFLEYDREQGISAENFIKGILRTGFIFGAWVGALFFISRG